MEWIIPLFTLMGLIVVLSLCISRKKRPKEVYGLMLVLGALMIFHIGDFFLWGGWIDYEVSRRIASIGLYLEIPALLVLLYLLMPKEKQTLLFRILVLILYLPWIYAILLIGNTPIVFLEGQGDYDESFVNVMVLAYVVCVIIIAVLAFMASKWRTDPLGKKLGKYFGYAIILTTVLNLFLFSTLQLFGEDYSWLFGIVNLGLGLSLWFGACPGRQALE